MSATMLKKEVRLVLIITLLTSTLLFTYLTPKADASPTPTITYISSSSGIVGDSVQTNGTITENGTYLIYFGEDIVKTGTASSQGIVNTTFSVPHSYQGNYTVRLYDINANESASFENFTVNTKYYINAVMPSQQTQLMEGQPATIRVSVTGGEANKTYWANVTVRLPYPLNNTVYYNSSLHLTNTTNHGEYVAEIVYPRDFGPQAHTNYIGTYKIAFNTTLADGSFKVGLTKMTQYHRGDIIAIQAANYTRVSNEKVLIKITLAGVSVISTNVNATGGMVYYNWNSKDASGGIYNVTITSAVSPGTVKPIRDTQLFIVGFLCQVQIIDLDNQAVSGVSVVAYNRTKVPPSVASDGSSDALGLAKLWLEPYTYSINASFNNVLVGNIPALTIVGNISLTLKCQLANIELHVKDKVGSPLPYILINLKYDGTIYGKKVSGTTKTIETDSTGILNFKNTFGNISYSVEAKRYGYVFLNTTIIGNLTASQQINIICPTYALFVHVVDSREHPLPRVSVNVTEWSSGILIGDKSWVTDDWGSVPLNLTFGRYKLQVYNDSAELGSLVVLNETIVDLTEDRLFETIHCRIANLSPSPSVLVIDYFGQPIPNAVIKIDRFSEIKQEWVEVMRRGTASNGIASLPSIGGDYSISLIVSGQLCGIKSVYIDETRMLIFKVDKYTAIGGLVIETNQLGVGIALGLLIIALITVLTYKRILHTITKRLFESEKKH